VSAALRDEFEGRGHDLMQTWALHRRGGERDGLPKVMGSGWSEPLDAEHVNEPEFVLAIDHILAGLYKSGFEHTVDIAKRFYLSGEAVWSLAPKVRRTEGFVRLTIRGVCDLVARRITA